MNIQAQKRGKGSGKWTVVRNPSSCLRHYTWPCSFSLVPCTDCRSSIQAGACTGYIRAHCFQPESGTCLCALNWLISNVNVTYYISIVLILRSAERICSSVSLIVVGEPDSTRLRAWSRPLSPTEFCRTVTQTLCCFPQVVAPKTAVIESRACCHWYLCL